MVLEIMYCAVSGVLRIIKTWTNAWATSHRCHETPILPCLFGCNDNIDSLSHYIMCPILFGLLSLLRPETLALPLVRFGAQDICRENLLTICCMFSAYHAIKREFRGCSLYSVLAPELCAKSHKIFVDVFFSEAKEVDLTCLAPRNLDISFLIAQSSAEPPLPLGG